MTSSSNPPLERGLDSMLLVYSLLQYHPASSDCDQFIRTKTGWFTSVLALLEAKVVLTKVYGTDPTLTSQKLAKLAGGPLVFLDLAPATVMQALTLADTHGIDLTDAVLLELVGQQPVPTLATEDQRLTKVCSTLGITVETPFTPILRQQVAAWEANHLPPKGLARVLQRVHQWLNQTHPTAGQDFWSLTGGASHLP
jgi:predicted nucleic acid-binding protein